MSDNSSDDDFTEAEKQQAREAIRRLQAIGTANLDQVEARISQRLEQYDLDGLERLAQDASVGNFVTIDPLVIRDALIHHLMKETHRRIDERKHLI